MDDQRLVKRLRCGDESVLSEIIFKYNRYVSTVVANQLRDFKNTAVIEELASDVFFELWQNRDRLTTSHLKGWLSTVSRNKAKNYIRAQKIQTESLDEKIEEDLDDFVAIPEEFLNLEREEQAQELRLALKKLKKHERETVVRYYFYNQTVTKISEETGTNIETVKSRLRRGRDSLKEILMNGGGSK
ncbi:MAG: sigma-70 family RNA polymerase sigma factor [Oscillospiraceae bacterium]|nr:sigma-70 family RNA polymerase sigma factor [Oscillospiraceae bacterium]